MNLGELFSTEIKNVEDASEYGSKLVESGAQHVIVSMAGRVLYFARMAIHIPLMFQKEKLSTRWVPVIPWWLVYWNI